MATLSLCMIVKNEEDTIQNCLNSVGDIFDEIIIVDTGSTDRTKEILKNYPVKTFDFSWVDDFAAARNYAFSLGTMDYLMWLDADDILLADDCEKLRQLKHKLDGKIRQILAPYNVAFDENNRPTLTYNRERIFLRKAGFLWIGAIHEVVNIEYGALIADFAVTHHKIHATETGRNLRIFRKLLKEEHVFDARQEFYYARELFFSQKYKEAIKQYKHFLKKTDAWKENQISACIDLAECYKVFQKIELAKSILFQSFLYDLPRGEVCCALGSIFIDLSQYEEAKFWYKVALEADKNRIINGFVNADCYGYIPAIQLCVCCDRLGNYKEAEEYNEIAARFKPYSSSVAHNREYFKMR